MPSLQSLLIDPLCSSADEYIKILIRSSEVHSSRFICKLPTKIASAAIWTSSPDTHCPVLYCVPEPRGFHRLEAGTWKPSRIYSCIAAEKERSRIFVWKTPVNRFPVSSALLQLYIKAGNQRSNKEDVRCVPRAFGLELRRKRYTAAWTDKSNPSFFVRRV